MIPYDKLLSNSKSFARTSAVFTKAVLKLSRWNRL